MICSSLCRVPFMAVLLSWVWENSHSRRSSFRGLRQLDRADELYSFFANCGASSVGFNVDEIEGANSSSSMDSTGYFERLSTFWESLFRIHFSRHSFYLREADDFVAFLRYGSLGETSSLVRPFQYITVAIDGSITTFSPELLGQKDRRFGTFAIGNITSDSLEEIAGGERFTRLKA